MTDADTPPPRPVDVLLDRLYGTTAVLGLAVAVTLAAMPLAALLGLWVRVFRWCAGV